MKERTGRIVLFLLSFVAVLVVSFGPLRELVRSGQPPDYYSHIPIVPLISAYVLFVRRRKFSGPTTGSRLAGGAPISLGCGLLILSWILPHDPVSLAGLRAAAAILLLSGSFIVLYGANGFRKALFPFLFLWFIMPLPLSWMGLIVTTLARVSAGFAHLLFLAFGVPFVQEGAIFRLPGFDIKVAHECSGIRSSLALLIISVLAGQIFLNRRWKKIVLASAIFPVTVMKNGFRIVTLYLLSYFVDIRIIEGGFLHRSGGFIFFGIGLLALVFLLWSLKISDGLGRAKLGE